MVKIGLISICSFINSFFIGSYLNGLVSIFMLQATPSFMFENIITTFLFGTFATFVNSLELCLISSRFSSNFGTLLSTGAGEIGFFELLDGFLGPFLLFEGIAYVLPYCFVYYVLPRAILRIFDGNAPSNPYMQLFFHFVSLGVGEDVRMYNPLYMYISALICVKFGEVLFILVKKVASFGTRRIERLENFGGGQQ